MTRAASHAISERMQRVRGTSSSHEVESEPRILTPASSRRGTRTVADSPQRHFRHINCPVPGHSPRQYTLGERDLALATVVLCAALSFNENGQATRDSTTDSTNVG